MFLLLDVRFVIFDSNNIGGGVVAVKGTKQTVQIETEPFEGTNAAEEAGMDRGAKEGWRIRTKPHEGTSFDEVTEMEMLLLWPKKVRDRNWAS